MARVNDGNLLQHAVELEAAGALSDLKLSSGLHVILTHGMAPYEPYEQKKRGNHTLLDTWLDSHQPKVGVIGKGEKALTILERVKRSMAFLNIQSTRKTMNLR